MQFHITSLAMHWFSLRCHLTGPRLHVHVCVCFGLKEGAPLVGIGYSVKVRIVVSGRWCAVGNVGFMLIELGTVRSPRRPTSFFCTLLRTISLLI